MSDLDLLKSASKRPCIHDTQMVFKLPTSIRVTIGLEAERLNISDAAVVREALSEYLERRGYGK